MTRAVKTPQILSKRQQREMLRGYLPQDYASKILVAIGKQYSGRLAKKRARSAFVWAVTKAGRYMKSDALEAKRSRKTKSKPGRKKGRKGRTLRGLLYGMKANGKTRQSVDPHVHEAQESIQRLSQMLRNLDK